MTVQQLIERMPPSFLHRLQMRGCQPTASTQIAGFALLESFDHHEAPCGLNLNQRRYSPIRRNDEDALTQDIVSLAGQYGRYGYRRITAPLNEQGWFVGLDRVQRIWRREGLKVPKQRKPRGRLWLNDGSCVRLRSERPNHVWSYDFVSARTHDGRSVRMMTLIDEFTREALAIKVARRLNSINVIETLADAMLIKGVPEHIRSDNGPEMTAKIVRD